MITAVQRKRVGPAHVKTLNAMWEQRMRWWLAHIWGTPAAEAKAAAEAARLHHELLVGTGLPDLMIREWEDGWDEWFETKLRKIAS